MATVARRVYALDVSFEITRAIDWPANFTVVIFDGLALPVKAESISVCYSNQLMGHLHPDDATVQLCAIYAALAPGGVYVCCTPNRLAGPHDVSRCFDEEAKGFHLKEYTATGLLTLLRKTGFSNLRIYCQVKQFYLRIPFIVIRTAEPLLKRLRFSTRRALSNNKLPYILFGVNIAALK
jgi:SAM-dependent methyltransferase